METSGTPAPDTIHDYLRAFDAAIWDARYTDRHRDRPLRLAVDADILWPSIAPLDDIATHCPDLMSRSRSSRRIRHQFVLTSLLTQGLLGDCAVVPHHEEELEQKINAARDSLEAPEPVWEALHNTIGQIDLSGVERWKLADATERRTSRAQALLASSVLSQCTAAQYSVLEALSTDIKGRQRSALTRVRVGQFDDITDQHETDLIHRQLRQDYESVMESKLEGHESHQRDVAALATILASFRAEGGGINSQTRFVTASPRVLRWVRNSTLIANLCGTPAHAVESSLDRVGSPFRSVLYCIVRCCHSALRFESPQVTATESQAGLGALDFISHRLWKAIKENKHAGRIADDFAAELGPLRSMFDDADDLRMVLDLWMHGVFTTRKAPGRVIQVLPMIESLRDPEARQQVRETFSSMRKAQVELVRSHVDHLARSGGTAVQRVLTTVAQTHEYVPTEATKSPNEELLLRCVVWEHGLPFWLGLSETTATDRLRRSSLAELMLAEVDSDLWKGALARVKALLTPTRNPADQESRMIAAYLLTCMGQDAYARRLLIAGCAHLWHGSLAEQWRASFLHQLASIGDAASAENDHPSNRFIATPDDQPSDYLDDQGSLVCLAMLCAARIDGLFQDGTATHPQIVTLAKRGLEALSRLPSAPTGDKGDAEDDFILATSWYLAGFQSDDETFLAACDAWKPGGRGVASHAHEIPWFGGMDAIRDLFHFWKLRSGIEGWPLFHLEQQREKQEAHWTGDQGVPLPDQVEKLLIPKFKTGYRTIDSKRPVDRRRRDFLHRAERLPTNHNHPR